MNISAFLCQWAIFLILAALITLTPPLVSIFISGIYAMFTAISLQEKLYE
jgi:hypothetical protein